MVRELTLKEKDRGTIRNVTTVMLRVRRSLCLLEAFLDKPPQKFYPTALSLAAIMEISERLNSLPHHKNPQRAPKPRIGRQMLPTEMAWVQKVHENLHLNKMEKPA